MNVISAIKRGLLLLGSLTITYNLAQLLHEICHSMVAFSTGGTVGRILIHPFTWSYASSTTEYPFIRTLAGPLGAIVCGMLIFLLLCLWVKSFLLPLLLIGPLVLIHNGGYLLVDILMKSGGDACSMAENGIPPFVIIIAGVIFLLAGFALAVRLSRKTGLLVAVFKYRMITLALGIIPYLLTTLTWNFLYNRSEIMLWLTYAVSGSAFTVLLAAIPVKKTASKPHPPVGWKTIISIDLLAVAFLVFLLIGPLSKEAYAINKASAIKYYSQRPENFPTVLTAPSYGTDQRYSFLDQNAGYMLSYDVPESTSPNEIRNNLTNLHTNNGCILLKHYINDPNEMYDDNWKEKSSKEKEVTFKYKSYGQVWLKIDSGIDLVYLFVYYSWENNKFNQAGVFHSLIAADYSPESIFAYAALHPEEINPTQLEHLKSKLLPSTEKLSK